MNTTPATPLYVKQGRKYVLWGNTQRSDIEADVMRAGAFHLVWCPAPGEQRFRHDVTPDTAGFTAAAMIAQRAMEDAMQEAAGAKPTTTIQRYTKKQLAIIEKFRSDMRATGLLEPQWWTNASSREIAEAGILAVRELAAGKSK